MNLFYSKIREKKIKAGIPIFDINSQPEKIDEVFQDILSLRNIKQLADELDMTDKPTVAKEVATSEISTKPPALKDDPEKQQADIKRSLTVTKDPRRLPKESIMSTSAPVTPVPEKIPTITGYKFVSFDSLITNFVNFISTTDLNVNSISKIDVEIDVKNDNKKIRVEMTNGDEWQLTHTTKNNPID